MQFLLPRGPGTLGTHIPFWHLRATGPQLSLLESGGLFVTLEFNFPTSRKFTAQQSLGSFSGEVEFSLAGAFCGAESKAILPPSLGGFHDQGQMTPRLLSLQLQLPCRNPHICIWLK